MAVIVSRTQRTYFLPKRWEKIFTSAGQYFEKKFFYYFLKFFSIKKDILSTHKTDQINLCSNNIEASRLLKAKLKEKVFLDQLLMACARSTINHNLDGSPKRIVAFKTCIEKLFY